MEARACSPPRELLARTILKHPASEYEPDTTRRSSTTEFEHIAKYPEFVRIAVSYDEFPSVAGAIWGRIPSKSAWDTLAPTGRLRNGIGREVAVAYREHSGEPFHYTVMSYDERGRVEALLRYTENLGFDAVYYTYNSANLVTSVRVADMHRQHTTFYGYDFNARVDSVWTRLETVGSGLRAQPGNPASAARYPAVATRPDTVDILYDYTVKGQVQSMNYPVVNTLALYTYNRRGWLDSMNVSGPINGGMAVGPLFTEALAYDSSGQIVQQQYEHDGSPRVTMTYGYDPVNRLTVWGVGADSTTYAYDEVGNRTTETDWATGLLQSTTAYSIGGNGPNQLSSLQKMDANNQLIGGPTNYGYDADGAVIAKTVFVPSGGGGLTPQQENFAYSWRVQFVDPSRQAESARLQHDQDLHDHRLSAHRKARLLSPEPEYSTHLKFKGAKNMMPRVHVLGYSLLLRESTFLPSAMHLPEDIVVKRRHDVGDLLTTSSGPQTADDGAMWLEASQALFFTTVWTDEDPLCKTLIDRSEELRQAGVEEVVFYFTLGYVLQCNLEFTDEQLRNLSLSGAYLALSVVNLSE